MDLKLLLLRRCKAKSKQALTETIYLKVSQPQVAVAQSRWSQGRAVTTLHHKCKDQLQCRVMQE